PAAQKKHDRGWGGRRMRYPATEKLEIIRLVEQSPLPVRHTLAKLGIPRATFYRWYDRHSRGGPEALNDRSPRPDRVWNRSPDGGCGRPRGACRSAGACARSDRFTPCGVTPLTPIMGRTTDPGENHDPGKEERFTPSLTWRPRLENRLAPNRSL